ncbi:MAG: prolipoprotein diacylglyceryl transferase [Candidatus Gracilibacteria bacterium]|nr:prolipoprotein diacylglyceryl transferase [Candidatus Gracilibacteria bacterium]
MYALSFIVGYYILYKRDAIDRDKLDDLFLYIFLGVVLGGRFGYIFFYDFSNYLSNPVDIIKVWEGGMSFHGGVLGVILAMIIFSKKYKIGFLKLADQITLVLPIGLGLGRIGNYLNKELLGYSGYDGFLAVYLNNVGYFPSPLLEAFLEGFILFLILNYLYIKKILKKGQIASLFLVFYAIFRIFVEVFFRQPDVQIGYILGFFTMGQLLSIPMLIVGIILFLRFKNDK